MGVPFLKVVSSDFETLTWWTDLICVRSTSNSGFDTDLILLQTFPANQSVENEYMSKKSSEQSDHHIPSEGEYLVAGLSAGHNLQFHESHTKALLEFNDDLPSRVNAGL